MILNMGLTVADNKFGGLWFRLKVDLALLESVNNNQMIRNLCFLKDMSHGVTSWRINTIRRNILGHALLKNWTDSGEWKMSAPNFTIFS